MESSQQPGIRQLKIYNCYTPWTIYIQQYTSLVKRVIVHVCAYQHFFRISLDILD